MLLPVFAQVTVFQQEHYLANFVQSTFDALPQSELPGKTKALLVE
jgi:phosphoglucomutase